MIEQIIQYRDEAKELQNLFYFFAVEIYGKTVDNLSTLAATPEHKRKSEMHKLLLSIAFAKSVENQMKCSRYYDNTIQYQIFGAGGTPDEW